jgi:16S rRNA (guanine527-N7)-methyltransferase
MHQLWRSLAFASGSFGPPPVGLCIDLGSGGGVPGLVLAMAWPESTWLLLESNNRRAGWLASAVAALGVADRVTISCVRAELAGRSIWRHQAELVTARGFGGPGTTAECGAPLLCLGGRLLVADPPTTEPGRWHQEVLEQLGLRLDMTDVISTPAGPTSITKMVAASICPERYPRRTGVPAKRPLF